MSDQGNQGYPPYGQPGGYGPQPGQYGPPGQKPDNNAMILGLGGAGVLAVVILAFTAFVAPGFLTGDDDPVASSSSTPSASDEPGAVPSGSPASTPTFAEPNSEVAPAMRKMTVDFVSALNAGNKAAATAILCERSKQRLVEVFDRYVRYKTKVKIDSTSGSGNVAIARLSGTTRDEAAEGMVLVSDLQSPGAACVVTFYVVTIG